METKHARLGRFSPRRATSRVAQHFAHTRAWRVAVGTYNDFFDDRIPTMAAGITFFLLLAFVPGIACLVSLYGLFGHRAAIAEDLHRLSGFLPSGATAVLEQQLMRLTAQPSQKLGIGFLVGLLLAFWSASGGVRALIEGLDVAYEVRETRNILHLALDGLLFTTAVVVFLIVMITIDNFVPSLIARLPFANTVSAVLAIVAWPAAFVACAVLASIVYRLGPNRPDGGWHWFTWGGLIASAVWIGGTVLFARYVQTFGHYDRIYGDLGSLIGFLTWVWLSTLILLVGAEINREIECTHSESERS